jgi:hypothetical protein
LFSFYAFEIPADTFFDLEDGGTRNLALSVKNRDGTELDATSWAKFDSKNQTLAGLPKAFADVGTHRFLLEAADRSGQVSRLHFNVRILFAWWPTSNLLTQTFNFDFDTFTASAALQVDLLQRLSIGAGLSQSGDFTLMTVASFKSGSVRVTWKIKNGSCRKIQQSLNLMYYWNMTVKPSFLNAMGQFVPQDDFEYVGDCLSTTPVDAGALEVAASEDDDDVYKSRVIPAVVVAGVFLLVGILAFAMYRCRRRSRENVEAGTFVDRRPVIFDNDYIDDAVDMGRPIRPATVFEYERSVSPPSFVGSSHTTGEASTSGAEGGDEISEPSEEAGRRHSPPYQPPPPPFRSEPVAEQQPVKPRVPVYRKPPSYQPPS